MRFGRLKEFLAMLCCWRIRSLSVGSTEGFAKEVERRRRNGRRRRGRRAAPISIVLNLLRAKE